ncbi:MAG: FAD-dependent oxidoreductase [Desulfobacterales bacterium]
MTKQLVLAGGGHAHMMTLAHLDRFVSKGHRVTVVQPSEYHYYSGMGPGMLGKTYRPDEIRFATRHVVEKKGGTFVLGKIARVDPKENRVWMESGESLPFDVISFNVGSQVPRDRITGNGADIFAVKPIEKLLEAQRRILELVRQKKIAIGIIGGGPSAVEISGNIWRLVRGAANHRPAIVIYTKKTLMPGHPRRIRAKAHASLTARGIEVREQSDVAEIATGRIRLASGREEAADVVFVAVGVKPSPVFQASGLPTGPDGGLLVNRYLQSTAHPNMFGGGDCICFEERPLDKVGVYAVRQNPVLLHNLMAALEGGALQPFDPGGDYLLIFNLGDGTGIFRKKWLLFGGRPAFLVKDYIDRKFMREFQALE